MRAQSIVPERHVAEFPPPANRELGLGEMNEQEREQRFALFGLQLNDARGEAFIDEQSTPSVLERANNRMYDRRVGRDRLLPGFATTPTPQR